MKDKKTQRELLLILGILIIAGGFYLVNRLLNQAPAAKVEISVDGQVVEELDLSQNVSKIISGYGGGTNHLIIEEGTIRISEASCPDKVCVNQGKITESGDIIVCLPNRMIAKIVGD